MIKVLFVCMGNICRSPSAEGVFRFVVETAGLSEKIVIDSAGTHNYHIGAEPDKRSQQAASLRGYDLSQLRGRRVNSHDFEDFDYILAMDNDNLVNLQRICPAELAYKVKLFLEFGKKFNQREVPDPYYGDGQGFEHVLDLIEDASAGLLESIIANH